MLNKKKIIAVSILSGLVAINMAGCGGKPKQKNPVAAKTETAGEKAAESSTWEENAQIRAAISSQDYETAKKLAGERISESPRDARAHFLLGQALMGEGNLIKARESLQTALELSPNDRNYKRELNICLTALADSAMEKNLPSEAIDLLKQLLSDNFQTQETEKKLAEAYVKTSQNQLNSGNATDAESMLREALSVVPESPQVRTALAKMLFESDRLMEAERIFRSMRETHPQYVEGLTAYAKLLHRMGELNLANEVLNEVLRLSPENSEAAEIKGTINKDVPVIVVEQTNDSTISLVEAQNKLSMLEKTGNLLEQKKYLGIITSQYPAEFKALLQMSRVCEKLGQLDEALSFAEKYLTYEPQSETGKLQLARCLSQKGENSRALELIEEIEANYSDKLEIQNEKGQVLARAGNFAQAKTIWDNILKADGEYTATLFNYGQLEMETGKHVEAQTFFEKAIRKEPFNHKFRYFAGINLIQSGLKEQAYALWQSSRSSLNNDDPYAARILKALGDQAQSSTVINLNAPPPELSQSSVVDTTVVPSNVVNESPADPEYEKALEYARGGMFNEAINAFKSVVSRDNGNFNAIMNLGKVYTATANHNLACALFLKALKIDSRNIFALKALANSYAEIGMHTLAAQITEQVSVSQPEDLEGFPRYSQKNLKNNPRAFEPLAQAMIDEGLFAEASAVVQTGLAQQAEMTSLHLVQGDIYKSMRQFEQAMDSYKTALNRDPQSPVPFIKIGDLFMASGQLTSAADEYQKALKAGFIDPDNMFVIADRFRQMGREADAQRVLGRIKGMNLNQAQLLKLDQRLGTSLATPKEETQP